MTHLVPAASLACATPVIPRSSTHPGVDAGERATGAASGPRRKPTGLRGSSRDAVDPWTSPAERDGADARGARQPRRAAGRSARPGAAADEAPTETAPAGARHAPPGTVPSAVERNSATVHSILMALRRRPESLTGSAHFGRWLGEGGNLSIERAPAGEGAPSRLIVHSATDFEMRWLRSRCGRALEEVASEVLGSGSTVEFAVGSVDSAEPAGAPTTEEASAPARVAGAAASRATSLRHGSDAIPRAPRDVDHGTLGASLQFRGAVPPPDVPGAIAAVDDGSYLRPSLEEFVMGPSNEVAYRAASQMVDGGGPRSLFIDGSCGVGKTHLLRAICNRRRELNPRSEVLYTTGESFTNEFIAALRAHQLESFRARIRRLDLLAIDDVHFLADKDRTSSEFLHTIDHIGRHCNQVVLASDAPLDRLQAFSQALRSRLMQGVLVHIDLPDPALRRALVTRLAERRGLVLSPEAREYVATRIEGTAREIDGALQRVFLESRMGRGRAEHAAVDAVTVELALRDLAGDRGAPLRPQSIVSAVCTLLRLDRSDLLGTSRHPQIVLGRMLVTAVARRCTTLSFPEIGRLLGRAAHSTVHHAWRRSQALLASGERIPHAVETGPTTFSELVEQARRIARRPA